MEKFTNKEKKGTSRTSELLFTSDSQIWEQNYVRSGFGLGYGKPNPILSQVLLIFLNLKALSNQPYLLFG